MRKNLKISKIKINQTILLLSFLLFNPFIIGAIINPRIIRHSLVAFACLFFIIKSYHILSRKKVILLFGIFFIILFYFIYCLNIGIDMSQTFDFFFRALFIFCLFIYLSSKDNLILIIKPFVIITIVISCLTIISFLTSNFHLIPFQSTNIGGYPVGYNFFLGMVHWTYAIYYRPSLYFDEPSYLGFFLGFAFFYLSQAYWLKHRKLILSTVFISGVLTGSFTFYGAFIPALMVKFLNEKLLYKIKEKLSIIYFIAFLLISINYLTNVANFNNTPLSNFQTSLEGRKFRIFLSLLSLRNASTTDIILGRGQGFIDQRGLGESNAFVKFFIEEGLIATLLVLILIYIKLKHNIPLMLFCLLGFHSVVILDTPFLIFLLLISPIVNKLNKDPEHYNLILKSV
jgi:hypothetical protein